MSKVTGAEAKASVHALSTIAAMIFDMSMFLFVMVDKELPNIDRSATWPHQQQRACQLGLVLSNRSKTTRNQRSRFPTAPIVCGGNPPTGCQHAAIECICATCSKGGAALCGCEVCWIRGALRCRHPPI